LLRNLNHNIALLRQRVQHAGRKLVDPKRRLQDLALRCDELEQRLRLAWQRRIERLYNKLELLLSQVPSPDRHILVLSQKLTLLKNRNESQITRGLQLRQSKLGQLASVLDSLSPLKVVERGYSIARKDDQVVRSSKQLNVGDRLELVFAQGKADVVIQNLTHKE